MRNHIQNQLFEVNVIWNHIQTGMKERSYYIVTPQSSSRRKRGFNSPPHSPTPPHSHNSHSYIYTYSHSVNTVQKFTSSQVHHVTRLTQAHSSGGSLLKKCIIYHYTITSVNWNWSQLYEHAWRFSTGQNSSSNGAYTKPTYMYVYI